MSEHAPDRAVIGQENLEKTGAGGCPSAGKMDGGGGWVLEKVRDIRVVSCKKEDAQGCPERGRRNRVVLEKGRGQKCLDEEAESLGCPKGRKRDRGVLKK